MVAQTTSFFELLFFDGLLFGFLNFGDAVFKFLQVGWCLHALDAQTATGFVDEVDCFVGKMTIADVTVGEVCRSHKCLVSDGDAVVRFVLVADALQNFNGVGNRWLFNLDWLEATLKCRIFFEVLAVLIGCGGSDGLQFTTSKHWLQNGSGIDCAFSGARTYKSVNFIDEENDVTTCFDFFQNLLQTLFEIATVTTTGNECAEVECVQLLVLQCLRNIVAHNFLCETFNNCGFTNTWLTNENWVVLCTARENLHHTLKFARATNNWVKFFLASELREVATKLVENLASAFVASFFFAASGCTCSWGIALAGRALVSAQQLNDLLTNTTEVGTQLDEYLSSHAFALTNEAKEDVLGADVVVAELECFAQRQLKNFFGTRGEGDVTRR